MTINLDFTHNGKEYNITVVMESYEDQDWYIRDIEEYLPVEDDRTKAKTRVLEGKELDELCEELEFSSAFIDAVSTDLSAIADR